MLTYTLQVEVGEAGALAVIEGAKTGEFTPLLFVVVRNLAVQVERARKLHQTSAPRPKPPTIRELRRAA